VWRFLIFGCLADGIRDDLLDFCTSKYCFDLASGLRVGLSLHYAQKIIRLKKANKKRRQQLKEKNEQMKYYENSFHEQKDPEVLEQELRIVKPAAKRRR